MTTTDKPIVSVFMEIANLVLARKQHPVNQYESPLRVPVDDHWEIWVNGQTTPRRIANAPESTMAHDCEVPAFSAAVFFNGWLAGLVDPYGGVIAGGSGANEDTLLDALRIARSRS